MSYFNHFLTSKAACSRSLSCSNATQWAVFLSNVFPQNLNVVLFSHDSVSFEKVFWSTGWKTQSIIFPPCLSVQMVFLRVNASPFLQHICPNNSTFHLSQPQNWWSKSFFVQMRTLVLLGWRLWWSAFCSVCVQMLLLGSDFIAFSSYSRLKCSRTW